LDGATREAIKRRFECQLLPPPEGMRGPFRCQDLRVIGSDKRFSPFNVRLRPGSGLDTSLWQTEPLGQTYLVISVFFVRTQTDCLALHSGGMRPFPTCSVPMARCLGQVNTSQVSTGSSSDRDQRIAREHAAAPSCVLRRHADGVPLPARGMVHRLASYMVRPSKLHLLRQALAPWVRPLEVSE
jgi:hypothetical protein